MIQIEFDTKQLNQIINKVKISRKKENFGFPTEGINFTAKDSYLTIQATNGHQISQYRMPISCQNFSATIHPDIIAIALKSKSKTCILTFDDCLTIQSDKTQTFNLMEGEYPQILREWKPRFTATTIIDRKWLLNQCEIAVAYGGTDAIRLISENNRFRIAGEFDDGAFYAETEAPTYQHGDCYIDAQYLAKVLRAIKAKLVSLSFFTEWQTGTSLLSVWGDEVVHHIAAMLAKEKIEWVEAKPKPKPSPQPTPTSSQAILIRKNKQILCA
jgi:DNA polymerase III sliding clamp (beta) subunit (PCNA family)